MKRIPFSRIFSSEPISNSSRGGSFAPSYHVISSGPTVHFVAGNEYFKMLHAGPVSALGSGPVGTIIVGAASSSAMTTGSMP